MPGFQYPIDVGALADLVRKRGDDFVSFLGLGAADRDDVTLTKVAASSTPIWFPVAEDGTFHGAVDVGLPDADDPQLSFQGAAVLAIGDGEVLQANDAAVSKEGFCAGRVVIRHLATDGSPFFALYENICGIGVVEGQTVAAGDTLGAVGWHGDFPHLHFAIAAHKPLGGDDLAPERALSAMPTGLLVWNVRRVTVDSLDPEHWGDMPAGPWTVMNPIEAIRSLRGEESLEFPGRPVQATVGVSTETHELTLALHAPTQTVPLAFRSTVFKGSVLEGRRTDIDFGPMGEDGSGAPEEISALQAGLVALGYNVGRTGDKADGVDGTFASGTTQAVAHFQSTSLATVDDAALVSALVSASPPAGKVDWLTLMALDATIAAKESAPHPILAAAIAAPAPQAKLAGVFVDPLVRLISQWQPPWGDKTLHDTFTWSQAGCHPTCIAIVLRWFAEDLPLGSHQTSFPFPTKPDRKADDPVKDTHYPQRMCQAFFPKLPAGQCAAYPIAGGDTSVDHESLLDRAAGALGMSPKGDGKAPPGKVRLFNVVRTDVSGKSDDDKLALIKQKLKDGPVIVLLQAPGHFVVVQGVSDDGGIFVVDPGNILNRLVGRPPIVCKARMPDASAWPAPTPREELLPSAYVRFDSKAQYTFTQAAPKPKPGEAPAPPKVTTATFLGRVLQVEAFTFEGAPADDSDIPLAQTDNSAPIDWVFSQIVDASGAPMVASFTVTDLTGQVVAQGTTGQDGVVAVPVSAPGVFSIHAEPSFPVAPVSGTVEETGQNFNS